jgi:hypothetical protein
LGKTPQVDVEDIEDRLAFAAMVQEVSKVYDTRGITEEYVACCCWPLKAGWSIKVWLPKAQWTGGIPMPNFTASFNLKKHRECFLFLFFMFQFGFRTSFCVLTLVPLCRDQREFCGELGG